MPSSSYNSLRILSCVYVYCHLVAASELSILQTPADIRFVHSDSQLYENQLVELYSTAMGLSVQDFNKWPGITVLNPFLTSSAVIVFHLHDVPEFAARSRLPINYVYRLSRGGPGTLHADSLALIWQELARRTEAFDVDKDSVVVDMDAARAGDYYRTPFRVLRSIKSGRGRGNPCQPVTPYMLRNGSHAAEYFVKELTGLATITERVRMLKEYYAENDKSKDIIGSGKDIFIISIRSLRPLIELYGSEHSPAVATSFALLGSTMASLAQACRELYDGRALVTVLADDVRARRYLAGRKRAKNYTHDEDDDDYATYTNASGVEWYNLPYRGLTPLTADQRSSLNRAKRITPHTNALFAIALYFTICFAIALTAVILAFLSMDVGESSAIYRLTMPRKKRCY